MKSNVTVGPPIDLLAYSTDEFDITRHRRFDADDPSLVKIRLRWQQALRHAVQRLPEVRFISKPGAPEEETIELVEPSTPETVQQVQPPARQP